MIASFTVSAGYGAARALRNCTIALAFCASAVRAEPVTVVALGDSLTAGYGLPADQGFVPQLQAWLDAQGAEAVLENAGVSGDTTAGGLARLDWALSDQADALIVTLGGNDMLRGLPPDAARANLDAILAAAAERGLPVLLIGMSAPGNYGADYKAAFDGMYPDLAARYGAILAPNFFGPLLQGGVDAAAIRRYMQPDGIHPSAEGVARIVEGLGPQVVELVSRAEGG
jgi:acyl-CoA thioesterase-1